MKMTIEEAIKTTREIGCLSTIHPKLREATETLLSVAEAWVEVHKWLGSELCLLQKGHVQYVIGRMDQLLNPPPKTTIERVRSYAEFGLTYGTMGAKSEAEAEGYRIAMNDILSKLDQLEKEEKADDPR